MVPVTNNTITNANANTNAMNAALRYMSANQGQNYDDLWQKWLRMWGANQGQAAGARDRESPLAVVVENLLANGSQIGDGYITLRGSMPFGENANGNAQNIISLDTTSADGGYKSYGAGFYRNNKDDGFYIGAEIDPYDKRFFAGYNKNF